MNQPEKVWPLLKHSPDPRVRSYLIHRLGPLGADAKAIVKRLDEEPDMTIRRALILSLGEYGEKELLAGASQSVAAEVAGHLPHGDRSGPSCGGGMAVADMEAGGVAAKVNEEWAKDKEQREKRLDGIRQLLAKDKEKTPPQWYVNGQGQTMVVIPGPVEFMMGRRPRKSSRQDDETQHKRRIGRTFAIAAKSVTVEQYRQFETGYSLSSGQTYPGRRILPVGGHRTGIGRWQYCNG